MKAASERPETDALLFLALPGTTGTISYDKTIELNTEAPYVVSISASTEDGVYGTLDKLRLTCSFSQPVVVVGEDSGTPSIGLSLGGAAHSTRAIYSGGNGTNEFDFSYTVRRLGERAKTPILGRPKDLEFPQLPPHDGLHLIAALTYFTVLRYSTATTPSCSTTSLRTRFCCSRHGNKPWKGAEPRSEELPRTLHRQTTPVGIVERLEGFSGTDQMVYVAHM